MSPIQRLDMRFKLIGLFVLAFSFAFVKDISLLPLILFISGIVVFLAKLPIFLVLKGIKFPGIIIFAMAMLTLFFSKGEVVLQLGFATITKEGFHFFLLIVIRFISIMLLMFVLFNTSSILQIVAALSSLRLPILLCDMIFFSYRYLFELKRDFTTMQTAMRLRGFKGGLSSSLQAYSALAGSLLIRSYEQSERVYHAMTLRGYGEGEYQGEALSPSKNDYLLLTIFMLFSILIIILQYLL